MFQSIVSPIKFGFLNSLRQPKRRRLQTQDVGFGDSLEIRLLLTGPQLVNPIASDGFILTDVSSDHGGDLTVNVDVDGDGIYEFSEPATEGDLLLFDLTSYIAPNTNQNVTLQIVEDPDPILGGPAMSNSVTLNVAGIPVVAMDFDWIGGDDGVVSGAVVMTNSIGTINVLYRAAGDAEWSPVGEVTDSDGSFLFLFDLADGETDFEFVVEHTFLGASVLGSAVTITDMSAHIEADPGQTDPALDDEEAIDDLFAEEYV